MDTVSSPLQQASWPSIDGQNNWQNWTADAATCSRATTSTGSPAARRVTDSCGSAATGYVFDAYGDLASDGTYQYTWDALNRLVRVANSSGSTQVAYAYDAFNRRVVKVFPDNVASAAGKQANREAWYTYAGQSVIQESQPIGSIQPAGLNPTAPGVHILRQWIPGATTDEVLAMDVDANQNGASWACG